MNDIHITVLKYGRDNPGFSHAQLEEKFPEDYPWLKKEINHGKLFQTEQGDGSKLYLSFDDRSRLLEYEELRDARRSSKQAMIIAIVSILLTFGSIMYQFVNVQKVEVVSINDKIAEKHLTNNSRGTPQKGAP